MPIAVLRAEGCTMLGTLPRHRLAMAAAVAAASALMVSSIAVGSGLAAESRRGTPATPGSPDSGDSLFPHQGNGGYDVEHYAITLRWRPTGSITASVRIRAVATQALSSFSLDFRGLTVDSATVAGDSAGFSGPTNEELTITPATPVLDGQTFRTVIAYHGEPHYLIDPDGSADGWIPTSDGATVLSEPIGSMTWFPNNNTPSDKATYAITVTAPSSKTVASNGRLAGFSASPSPGHTATWRWREPDPMASYLATVSIGDYDVVKATSNRGVLLRSFVDTSMSGVRTARHVGGVVDYLSTQFGPYPLRSAGIIVDNVPVSYALEVQTRPVFPYDPGVSGLLAHELAHQWFGDSVSLNDWSHIWLNEGFATYAEWLWQARTQPNAPARRFHSLYHGNGSGSPFWNGVVAQPATPADLFDTNIVYTRGAMALEALRLTIGSNDFFTLVHRWSARLGGANGTTARFEAMAENVSGDNLDLLFENWLHSSGRPPAL
jgi:aminopeptidase N